MSERKLRGILPGMATTRESDVITLMALGYENRQIANVLEISMSTVDTHRTNIRRRMGFRSLVDVVHYALHRGLVKNKYAGKD
jgi:two-component system response regulator NreC